MAHQYAVVSISSPQFTYLHINNLFSCSARPPSLSRPLLLFSHLLSYIPFLSYSDRDKAGLARTQWFVNLGSGYTALQSTQPQTLGYALADSPVGLLAWIYEKLVQWTDEYKWDDDEGTPDYSSALHQLELKLLLFQFLLGCQYTISPVLDLPPPCGYTTKPQRTGQLRTASPSHRDTRISPRKYLSSHESM